MTNHHCYLRPAMLCATLLAAAIPVSGQTPPPFFGVNLIVNGDAESGPGVDHYSLVDSIPGWTSNGANVITYASGYGISLADLIPVGAGLNYFSSGDTSSSLLQTIDLTPGADVIDAGVATFDASGYFGGWGYHDDYAVLTVAFLDGAGNPLSSLSLGGLKRDDRWGTGMYLRRQIGAVPAGARTAQASLDFTVFGSYDNAGADNLSLILNSPASLPAPFGSNLILDGDAEQAAQLLNDVTFAADIPNWVRTPSFTTAIYGATFSDLDLTSPAPPDQGTRYFAGGAGVEGPVSSAYQDIDISQGAIQIDSGGVTYTLSGWLGGYSSQQDYATLTLQFLDWPGTVLSNTVLGPVPNVDRDNISGLLPQSASGTVPAGARMAHVVIEMTRLEFTYNDGAADSVSLILWGLNDNSSQRRQKEVRRK